MSQIDSLDETQRQLFVQLLDTLIPPNPEGGQPGAGEVGLAGPIEAAFAELPGAVSGLAEGLAGLDEHSRTQRGQAFGALDADAREDVLRSYADASPGFLPGLLFQVYNRYYAEARVLESCGIPGRPPHPIGYELEMGDLDLLDPVRARKPLYRPTE